MDVIRVSATAHILNYLPMYYAESRGLYAARGLQVPTHAREPWTRVLDDLRSGDVDVALCGLWVPAMLDGVRDDLAAVGQVNGRCPMAIVSRVDVPDFAPTWLASKTLLVPGYTGTVPYVFAAGVMREAGLDPRDVRFVRDLSRELLLELYGAGIGDAILVDMLTACRLEAEGKGFIAYDLADAGVMSNSVYIVRRDRLESLRGSVSAFLDAIDQSMRALDGGDPSDITELLVEQWPDIDSDVVSDAAGRLMANGTWESIRIDRAGCARMSTMVYEAGLSRRAPEYEDLVDDSFLASADA